MMPPVDADVQVLRYFETLYGDLPREMYTRRGITDLEFQDLMWMVTFAPIPEPQGPEITFIDRSLQNIGIGHMWSGAKLISWWLEKLKEQGKM